MNRWMLFGLLLAVAAGFGLSHLTRPQGASGGGTVVVDSLRVGEVGDSIHAASVRARDTLELLRSIMATASPDTVWRVVRRLVRDTVDTGRVDTLRLVARLVVDDSACRVRCDSLTGDAMLWKTRDKAHAEAFRLCQSAQGSLPAPADGGTTWTASMVLQGDGEALRPGLGLDWRWTHLQLGGEAYARTDGTRPGAGLRVGINW